MNEGRSRVSIPGRKGKLARVAMTQPALVEFRDALGVGLPLFVQCVARREVSRSFWFGLIG